MFKFEYAIKNSEGQYYNGNTSPSPMWGSKSQVYTYTCQGAERKIDSFPCFKGCTIEKIL